MDLPVPLVLPRGVRFYASDEDLIDVILPPWVNSVPDPLCLIQGYDVFRVEPDFWHRPYQPYYPPDQYWYFDTRQQIPGTNRANREIREPAAGGGKWVYKGTKKIFRGLQLIGHKESLQFNTVTGLATGWRLYEYRQATANNVFQSRVLIHVVYQENEDERN